MTVTISEFRKSLFQLVEKARNGESVEFTHQGEVFCVVPQKRPSRMARLAAWGGLPSDPSFPSMTAEDWDDFRNERRAASDRKFEIDQE